MNRKYLVIIFIISTVVLLAGIGLWRNHYLNIQNAEPEKVFIDKPVGRSVGQSKLPTDANTPIVTTEEGENKKDLEEDNKVVNDVDPSITTQDIDSSITPDEKDKSDNSSFHTIFSDLDLRNLPPEAELALKTYEDIQLAIPDLNNELFI